MNDFIIPQCYTTLYIDDREGIDIDMDHLEEVLSGEVGLYRFKYRRQGSYRPLTEANEILTDEYVHVLMEEMWHYILCSGCLNPKYLPKGAIWLTKI